MIRAKMDWHHQSPYKASAQVASAQPVKRDPAVSRLLSFSLYAYVYRIIDPVGLILISRCLFYGRKWMNTNALAKPLLPDLLLYSQPKVP